ncbi:MAG TPA: DUF4149 domain-containing protein [Blastocatellia bacterium]|nr:DUF4149 domain-containing protein [Blastocatellia bacterium]HMV82868.1 DUF4149 domain-containing protein [Blastocatellia bacterium]HMX24413.1 DUF4149 domain-containing protein [Blastocatellia bacterium]HMY72826.1 DUF4149 domain-containing protein [Blastocatellia bacterium]HMZ19851.1 DUF4149 domain-containing protein [Blastocatellia bacterium]
MNQKTRIALLSFWLGTMSFFSFVLAPAAFAVLPTQHLAGQVVSQTLGTAELIGIVIGAALLLLLLFARGRKSKIFFFELFTVALMTAAMVGSKVVSGRMHALRVQAGEALYKLPSTDSLRASFDQLHRVSVGLTGFAIVAAIVLIAMLVGRKDALYGNA